MLADPYVASFHELFAGNQLCRAEILHQPKVPSSLHQGGKRRQQKRGAVPGGFHPLQQSPARKAGRRPSKIITALPLKAGDSVADVAEGRDITPSSSPTWWVIAGAFTRLRSIRGTANIWPASSANWTLRTLRSFNPKRMTSCCPNSGFNLSVFALSHYLRAQLRKRTGSSDGQHQKGA